MFMVSEPNPVKKATAIETLAVVNDVCNTLSGTNISVFALSTGLRSIAHHFGWRSEELLAHWPERR